VRQLENVVFRAVTLCDRPQLGAEDLDLAAARGIVRQDAVQSDPESWEEAVAAFEKALLHRLYPRYPSSRKLAARLRSSHTMIANKLRKFGLPEGRAR
jgi:TyrR family helix-turn-helix protein